MTVQIATITKVEPKEWGHQIALSGVGRTGLSIGPEDCDHQPQVGDQVEVDTDNWLALSIAGHPVRNPDCQ